MVMKVVHALRQMESQMKTLVENSLVTPVW